MNRRLLGNILIITLLIISISGILMYLKPFAKNIASLHTLFALLFLLAMIFHIINNKLPLSNYISGKRLSKFKKLQSPLVFLIFFLVTIGIYYNTPILNSVYDWGNQYRNKQIKKEDKLFDYQIITLDKKIGNHKISIELKKGKAFRHPLFAVWIEDSIGNYIETLYISKVIASSTFNFGKKVDGKWKPATIRRPEALPYWSHKRNIKASDGLFIPLHKSADLDAVSGATATSNFVINSETNLNNKNNYRILVELNQSFDWNDFYSKDKFPNDKIYSGSGKVGQPSLIYATEISNTNIKSTLHKIMTLRGHGHYSGKNGKLFTDLTNITTAKQIADRIILTVEKN